MASRKQLERRTYLQDRFEILIKRQKSGKATFSELTELDEIVNRDPELREKVIRESILMQDTANFDDPPADPENKSVLQSTPAARLNVLARVKAFLGRVFLAKAIATKHRFPALRSGQLIMV